MNASRVARAVAKLVKNQGSFEVFCPECGSRNTFSGAELEWRSTKLAYQAIDAVFEEMTEALESAQSMPTSQSLSSLRQLRQELSREHTLAIQRTNT